MVAAFLKGLLKPAHAYGLRSVLAESAILEAMEADIAAETYALGCVMDTNILPVLTHKGMKETLRSTNKRAARHYELRSMDIYRLDGHLRAAQMRAENKNTLSLYQLYQLAQKNGIFEALRARSPAEENI